jgi:hypothetical protein
MRLYFLFLVNQEESSLFLHKNLLEFSLGENGSEITPKQLAYFIRHMPILQKLFIYIGQTQNKSFACYSYIEDILSYSIVEFQYFVRIDNLTSDDIEINVDEKSAHRFPMKKYCNMIYTVPWRWFLLPWEIPLDDYHQSCVDKTKSIFLYPYENENEILINIVKPWDHVTLIGTKVKISSLKNFRCLRTLRTGDGSVVHSRLPSTLRSLDLTGKSLAFLIIHIQSFFFIK